MRSFIPYKNYTDKLANWYWAIHRRDHVRSDVLNSGLAHIQASRSNTCMYLAHQNDLQCRASSLFCFWGHQQSAWRFKSEIECVSLTSHRIITQFLQCSMKRVQSFMNEFEWTGDTKINDPSSSLPHFFLFWQNERKRVKVEKSNWIADQYHHGHMSVV